MQVVWYTDCRRVRGSGFEFVKHTYVNTPETSPDWEYYTRKYTGAEHRCDETTGTPWAKEYRGTVSVVEVIQKIASGMK